MKNIVRQIGLLLVFISTKSISQTPVTITKPESPATGYTVTGNETLTASQSITLKPNTWIKAGSTFAAIISPNAYASVALSNENYIFTRSFQVPYKSPDNILYNSDVIESVTYYDGLGRAMQNIGIKASPTGNDVMTHIGYDRFGRSDTDYLSSPSLTGAIGSYRTGADLTTNNYYTANYPADINSLMPNAFAKKELENSPLSRVLQQSAPGNDWALANNHTVRYDYQANTANEVKFYRVNTVWNSGSGLYNTTFEDAGSYAANQLYKTITYDENSNGLIENAGSSVEFKNKDGQIVLKRTYDNYKRHDTYYVYDQNGNLTYVLPPLTDAKLVESTSLPGAGYDNFSKTFDQSLFTGIPGSGQVKVSITDNVLNVAFDTAVETNTLLQVPQDLPTTPCSLPDMNLGNALSGKYSVNIVGGKLSFLLNNPSGPADGVVSGFHETLTTNLGGSYSNFSKAFDYYVFSGRPGGGGYVTVTIVNNVLKVEFGAGFTDTELVETPQDLATTPLLPDMNLGTILDGKYRVNIIGGKIKLTNLTKFPNGLRKTANLPNACKSLVLLHDQILMDDLFYQYKYDARNRLVEKKVPGKQWEYIVYDKLDRVVATGPAYSPFNDSAGGTVGWMITKYDVFNRPVYTGWEQSTTINSAGRSLKQIAVNALTNFNESKTTTPTTVDNLTGIVYYTNSVAPTAFKLLTVNYYDDYVFTTARGITVPTAVEGQNTLSGAQVKGLLTADWIRVPTSLSGILAEVTANFYDAKGRSVRNYHQNHLGGYTYTDTNLNFTGIPQYAISYHKRLSGSTELKTKEVFTYSPQGRLLTHTHQINTDIPQLLVAVTYDELGQLTSKKVGNTTAVPLQKVDFTYNIRGWLKGINTTAALQQNTDPKDLFALSINYNTPTVGIPGVSSLYNGNISETQWSSDFDNGVIRSYGYKYDNLSRLKESVSKKGSVLGAYNESISYDKNGNIMSLIRNGTSETVTAIDNLVYSYGTDNLKNQLTKVEDNSSKNLGFIDSLTNTADDYSYDSNGNMIRDNNKNITSIIYNHLNLPIKITFGTTGNIAYIYNASGQKLQKTVTVASPSSTTTTDYLGAYQYLNAALQFFPVSEGYVEAVTASSFKYVFQYKDHLGNVRLSYKDSDGNGVISSSEILEQNDYYAFGLKQSGYGPAIQSTNAGLKYKYNGKELQDELGLAVYDYGARNYDPALGRFMSLDPMAEKRNWLSPYNYVQNNPILKIDPDGMLDGDYYTNDGDWLGNDGVDDKKVHVVNDGDYKPIGGGKTNIYKSTELKGITNEILLAFASVIHAESGGSKDESYAIGNVTMNFVDGGGSRQVPTLEDAVMYDNNFAQGATQNNLTSFMGFGDKNSKFAMGAAINAIGNSQGISGFSDYSGGANGWDGIDLISSKWSNSHRGYTWSEGSKELLSTYKKDNNGGVDVSGFTYKKSGYQISATKIIGNTIYTNITTGRGEKKQSNTRFHL